MIRTYIDENMRKKLDQAEQEKLQALENERIEFAISLFDVVDDIKIIATKAKLTIEKVRELKEEYLNKQDFQTN